MMLQHLKRATQTDAHKPQIPNNYNYDNNNHHNDKKILIHKTNN